MDYMRNAHPARIGVARFFPWPQETRFELTGRFIFPQYFDSYRNCRAVIRFHTYFKGKHPVITEDCSILELIEKFYLTKLFTDDESQSMLANQHPP